MSLQVAPRSQVTPAVLVEVAAHAERSEGVLQVVVSGRGFRLRKAELCGALRGVRQPDRALGVARGEGRVRVGPEGFDRITSFGSAK